MRARNYTRSRIFLIIYQSQNVVYGRVNNDYLDVSLYRQNYNENILLETYIVDVRLRDIRLEICRTNDGENF